jgi:N-acetyl-anhydromuramyl-L-alanine amidase AmpD
MPKAQFKKRSQTDFIVVHCAATKASMDIGVREIRQWHVQKGWLDVGYHFVIRRNGTVEDGRPHDVVGAHVEGFNSRSIGICLAGGIDAKGNPENNFTPEQFNSLKLMLIAQMRTYPHATVVGHNDLFKGKACPSFKVSTWLQSVGL